MGRAARWAAVRDLLANFLAAYAHNRAAPVIEERLNRLGDPSQAEARDREIRDYAKCLIDVRVSELDPLSIDWNDSQGTAVVDQVSKDVYALIEARRVMRFQLRTDPSQPAVPAALLDWFPGERLATVQSGAPRRRTASGVKGARSALSRSVSRRR